MPKRKLTPEEVKDIKRKLLMHEIVKPSEILKQYPNLTRMDLSNIRNGVTYKDVEI